MNNRYTKTLLLGALALTLGINSGCESNIDLEPEGFISVDNYFKSADDYQKSLNALYYRFCYGDNDLWIDGVTDNGTVTHSWNRGYDFSRGFATSSSAFAQYKWGDGYVGINRANTVINNIDNYAWPGGESNAERNRILGEAIVVRDYIYMELAALYGRIMFYTVNPETVADSKEVKQTDGPKEVFDFILDDLKTAIAGLPQTPANKSMVSKPAARLLRARCAAYAAGYLKDNSYFNITLEETKELLANAPQLADFGKLFRTGCQNEDEVILVKDFNEDSKNWWGQWYNQSLGGYCVTTPLKSLADAFEYLGGERNDDMPYLNKDPRFYETMYAPGSELRGRYFNSIPNNVEQKADGKWYFKSSGDYGSMQDKTVIIGDVLSEGGGGEWNKTQTGLTWKKYFAEDETWSTWNPFVVFRYAEAYLLRAEALVETGGSTEEAKSLVKVIRDRAGNTNDIDWAVTNLYNGSLRDLIRNERRVEFAQEGLRLYDIRRWGIMLDVMNKPMEGIEYNEYDANGQKTGKRIVLQVPGGERGTFTQKDYWWPIPQAELDLNPGVITQNDQW